MKRVRGFTLIEVLLALFLFSLILGVVYAAFFNIHMASTSSKGVVIKLQEARATMDMMKREIEAAMPDTSGERAIEILDRDVFGAQASVLSFDTFLSPLPGGAVIRYSVREVDGGESLVLQKTVGKVGQDIDGYGNESITVDAVEDIKSILIEARSRREWHKTWRESKHPEDVKVTLTINLNGKDVPLTFVAKPYIGGTP